MPLLIDDASQAFWVVSADIYAPTFEFSGAAARRFAAGDAWAHLWLVPNPAYHARGDFGLGADGYGVADGPGPDGRTWTYANVALCRAPLFDTVTPGARAALGPLLFDAMRARRVSAEVFEGAWDNVGTPAQLAELNRRAQPGTSPPGGD
jgi:MurNAc alpha-1-phosphate uridylyltransferase